MSVHVSSWAWKQKVGDPGTKLVLVKLADNADDTGYSYWKQKNLAVECEMARSTCQKKIDKLVSMGLVEVIARYGPDGQQVSNGYRLVRPGDPARISGTGADSGEAGGATPGRAGGATPGRAAEPSVEPSEKKLLTYTQIADGWLGHEVLIAHRPSYFESRDIRYRIDQAVKRYGIDDVLAAIASYAMVLASAEHFFNHSWTLGDFLKRGLDRFVPEAQPERVFKEKTAGVTSEPDGHNGLKRFARDDD